MTQEALKLALEALEGVLDDAPKVLDASIAGGLYEVVQCRDAITAIKEALAQPEQEPVALRDALAGALTSTYVCGRVWSAWNVGTMTEDDFQRADECNELLDGLVQAVAATSPPKRPWVELTDEEISVLSKGHMTRNGFARNVLAKSKEKNI